MKCMQIKFIPLPTDTWDHQIPAQILAHMCYMRKRLYRSLPSAFPGYDDSSERYNRSLILRH